MVNIATKNIVMNMRVALSSGGKESLYAMIKTGDVDLALFLIYDFPRPSPHLINMGKSIESITSTGIPVVIAELPKGREKDSTVKLLRMLSADGLVAGDVYVEDHLRYMESLAKECGARLYEPLWGMDPEELLYEEIKHGLNPLIIGCQRELTRWLGKHITIDNVDVFIQQAKKHGIDPLGEMGEYHTLIIDSPIHKKRINYKIVEKLVYNNYYILRVV